MSCAQAHAALSAWPGVENCHCKEAKRDPIASRPRLVPCACAAPTASPAASGSSPGSASDGVRRRPAAASAEARASQAGSCTAASSRVRPRSTASRALAAPVELRHVVFSVPRALRRRRLWHLLILFTSTKPPVHEATRSYRFIISASSWIAITHLPPAENATKTVANTHASALTTTRAHRDTRAQKKTRAKPQQARIGFGAPFFAHHD